MAFRFRHGDRPLDGFTIQRGVGRGGFGEVYYAVSDGGREVALKYLRDNAGMELRGVSQCMNLKSPHLVTIFDVKQDADDEYFIVMEYIQGPSLRDMLTAQPDGLGPQKAAFFVRELAKGLDYLHDHGIVHRDMKPGNVFYDDGYVKIGDYGLSKFIPLSQHSAQTASVGTVHYMAPEIGSGQYQRGIDIYALGVMLYELLMGRVPYEGSSMGEVLMKHLAAQPEVSDLPEPFGAVIRKALAKDPADRYQTAGEMAEDLLEVETVRDSLTGFDPASMVEGISLAPGPASPAQPFAGAPAPPAHQQPSPRVAAPPPPLVGTGPMRAAATAAATAVRAAEAGAAGTPGHVQSPVRYATDLSPEAASGTLYYAGFWIRFAAALIDMIIIAAATSAIFWRDDPYPILAILYDGILIGRWNGQTIGKRICGIKVISADGRPCTMGQSFGRAVAQLLSVLTLFIGYIMAAFDEQKRALHDRIAYTLHVYAIDRW
jgi:uncharacterized RDD family membrane protein YckC